MTSSNLFADNNNWIAEGTRVEHLNRRTGELLRGRVRCVDGTRGSGYYFVNWNHHGIGGGWHESDLTIVA